MMAARPWEERIAPQDLDAEEATLGSMMLRHAAVPEVEALLDPEDFYKESHRHIYKALIELYGRGSTTDPVVLADELRGRGLLEAVGDKAYIFMLIDSTPNEHNAVRYANLVREMALRRRLIDASYQIESVAHDLSEEVVAAYDKAEGAVFSIGQRIRRQGVSHIKGALVESFDRMTEVMDSGERTTGVTTGFYRLDELISGLQPANLIIVGARTSTGKTSFALNVAQHVSLLRKTGVLIFSLEMRKMEIADRLLCGHARVDSHRFKIGQLDEVELQRIIEAAGALSRAPIYIDDTGDISMSGIRSTARQMVSKGDVGLVIVDYIQQLHTKAESRVQEVSKIARELKVLAMQLDVPVIAVSQLRRPPQPPGERKRPKAVEDLRGPSLEDLKESGSIEQNADVVILLFRPEAEGVTDPMVQGLAKVHVAKNRNGRTGHFDLVWIGEYTKFENLDEDMYAMDVIPPK
jgi:replicative DNA helicase